MIATGKLAAIVALCRRLVASPEIFRGAVRVGHDGGALTLPAGSGRPRRLPFVWSTAP
jgi:hypothetical protein